jgi:pimeloyl-ACP methyl ester carboxylesterase
MQGAGDWTDQSPHRPLFVEANGARLQCLDWGGSGPNLILIHGANGSPHLFDDLAPALTDGFRVVAYARRGHGKSDPKGPFDTATLTEDLRGVMDSFGISRAHLAGHSMGGNEITAMAGTHPEYVDRIVYLDAGYDWADPRIAEGLSSLPPHLAETPADVMASMEAYRADFWRSFPALNDSAPFEGWMRDTVQVEPDGSLRATMSDAVGEALVAALFSERRNYTRVHAPALAIYSDSFWDIRHGDPAHVAANLAWEQKYVVEFRADSIDRIRRELPGVEIVRLSGTHPDLVFTCQPEILAWLRRFLRPR